MAKTLRPILCPQCGSPAKTTLGPDRYRCNACQTEYYLDSDDVTVHARPHYAAPSPPTLGRNWCSCSASVRGHRLHHPAACR